MWVCNWYSCWITCSVIQMNILHGRKKQNKNNMFNWCSIILPFDYLSRQIFEFANHTRVELLPQWFTWKSYMEEKINKKTISSIDAPNFNFQLFVKTNIWVCKWYSCWITGSVIHMKILHRRKKTKKTNQFNDAPQF